MSEHHAQAQGCVAHARAMALAITYKAGVPPQVCVGQNKVAGVSAPFGESDAQSGGSIWIGGLVVAVVIIEGNASAQIGKNQTPAFAKVSLEIQSQGKRPCGIGYHDVSLSNGAKEPNPLPAHSKGCVETNGTHVMSGHFRTGGYSRTPGKL